MKPRTIIIAALIAVLAAAFLVLWAVNSRQAVDFQEIEENALRIALHTTAEVKVAEEVRAAFPSPDGNYLLIMTSDGYTRIFGLKDNRSGVTRRISVPPIDDFIVDEMLQGIPGVSAKKLLIDLFKAGYINDCAGLTDKYLSLKGPNEMNVPGYGAKARGIMYYALDYQRRSIDVPPRISWSPNSKYIAFNVGWGSGAQYLYILAVKNGTAELIEYFGHHNDYFQTLNKHFLPDEIFRNLVYENRWINGDTISLETRVESVVLIKQGKTKSDLARLTILIKEIDKPESRLSVDMHSELYVSDHYTVGKGIKRQSKRAEMVILADSLAGTLEAFTKKYPQKYAADGNYFMIKGKPSPAELKELQRALGKSSGTFIEAIRERAQLLFR
jgi:hypothetical protein